MSQVSPSPEWPERLRAALAASGHSVDDLRKRMALPEDGGWLSAALAGEVEPEMAELALLSAYADVPLAVLTGEIPTNRSLALALRAGLLCTSEDTEATTRRASVILDLVPLLLAWFPQEALRTDTHATTAQGAVSPHNY